METIRRQARRPAKLCSWRGTILVATILCGVMTAGCDLGTPPPADAFGLSSTSQQALADVKVIDTQAEADLRAHLARMFGTPADPIVPDGVPVAGSGPASSAALTMQEAGALYREECQHCHGIEGGGDGPTGTYLRPQPRDFRSGLFKWTHSAYGSRPLLHDLERALVLGVPGTSMSSFTKLSKPQVTGVSRYIQLLAMRGELEQLLLEIAVDKGALVEADVASEWELVLERWETAEAQQVEVPTPVPHVSSEMLARGRELFEGSAKCSTCHGIDGAGDGPSIWESNAAGEQVRRVDEWGQESRPRNFKRGQFRGGSQPADLYRRIRAGITGSIMPAAATTLSSKDVWSLVFYVLSLVDSPSNKKGRPQ